MKLKIMTGNLKHLTENTKEIYSRRRRRCRKGQIIFLAIFHLILP
jgi:predicted nucleic acid-binding Zn ribbon protein